MTLENLKKFLRKELIDSTDSKVRFDNLDPATTGLIKLYASITRSDGQKQRVYWSIYRSPKTLDCKLNNIWYYPVNK